MTIEEMYRKLKAKDKSYIVTEDQWGAVFDEAVSYFNWHEGSDDEE